MTAAATTDEDATAIADRAAAATADVIATAIVIPPVIIDRACIDVTMNQRTEARGFDPRVSSFIHSLNDSRGAAGGGYLKSSGPCATSVNRARPYSTVT